MRQLLGKQEVAIKLQQPRLVLPPQQSPPAPLSEGLATFFWGGSEVELALISCTFSFGPKLSSKSAMCIALLGSC